jgi:hypothetical protein
MIGGSRGGPENHEGGKANSLPDPATEGMFGDV